MLVGIDPAGLGDGAQIGVDDRIDGVDGNAPPGHELGALGKRRVEADMRGIGDILGDDDAPHRLVDHVGDGEHALAVRGRAGQGRSRRHRKFGRARDDGVERADARDEHDVDVEPFLLPEAQIVRGIDAEELHHLGRQRQHRMLVRGARRQREEQEQGREPRAHHRASPGMVPAGKVMQ